MGHSEQFGFDFGADAPVLRAMPAGTWLDKSYTRLAIEEGFARAKAHLAHLEDVERDVLALTLNAAIAGHEESMSWRSKGDNDDQLYTLRRFNPDYDDELVLCFIAHCKCQLVARASSAEYKVTDTPDDVSVGVYYPGIGSVVARWYKRSGNSSIDFSFGRDTHFLDSYRDAFDAVYCDQLVWEDVYAAQTLAESGDKIASVRTFTVGAREYVNKGAHWSKDYAQCIAYAIVPACEWQGDTYTYKTLIQAFDNGAKERGDSRGLLVRVRGQLCVLEKFVSVYDDRPRTAPIGMSTCAEEAPAEDEDDGWSAATVPQDEEVEPV